MLRHLGLESSFEGHVASGLVVSCSGSVGGESRGAFGGVYASVGLPSVVLRLSRLPGVLYCTFILLATTLINYNTA